MLRPCFSLILFSLLLNACAALPLPIEIPIESRTTVEGGTALEQMLGSMQFSEFTAINIAQSEAMQNSYMARNHIVAAAVRSLGLRIESPADQNFDFIEEMAFFVSADGLPRKRIAHRQVPKGARSVDFVIDATDLTPYVKAETMNVTTEVKARRPGQDTVIHSRLVIAVQTALF